MLQLEVLVIIEKGELRLSLCYEEDDCIVARGLVVGTTVSMLLAERMKRSFSVEKKINQSASLLEKVEDNGSGALWVRQIISYVLDLIVNGEEIIN